MRTPKSARLAAALIGSLLAAQSAIAEPCVSCMLESRMRCVAPGDDYHLSACLRNDCRDIREATANLVAVLPGGDEVDLGSKTTTLVGGSGWQCADLSLTVPLNAPEGSYTLRIDGWSINERFTCSIEVLVDEDCDRDH